MHLANNGAHQNPEEELVAEPDTAADNNNSRPLTIASFGDLPVRYAPVTYFAKEWEGKLPAGANLAIIFADTWRSHQMQLFDKPGQRQRFGFRDVDEKSKRLLPLATRGRPSARAHAPANALEGSNYFRNLYSILLKEHISHKMFQLCSVDEISLQEWVRNVMQGGAHMLMTPAFLAKCQAAVAEVRNPSLAQVERHDGFIAEVELLPDNNHRRAVPFLVTYSWKVWTR